MGRNFMKSLIRFSNYMKSLKLIGREFLKSLISFSNYMKLCSKDFLKSLPMGLREGVSKLRIDGNQEKERRGEEGLWGRIGSEISHETTRRGTRGSKKLEGEGRGANGG